MPRSWLCLLAGSTAFFVGFQEPDDGLPPLGEPPARPRVVVPGRSSAADPGSVELAGLPEGTRAEVLTWERAYKLALVRARTVPGKEARREATLDPRRLDEEANRAGFTDFARFRRDFRTGGSGTFRDPAPALLDVARRARAAEDTLRHVKAHERRFREAIELARRAESGRTQLGIDQLDDALQQARVVMFAQTRRYRDGLDALKVELGLAPEAAVIIDPSILADFGRVFEAAEAWLDGPVRNLSRLGEIGNALPRLDDVAIGDRSAFAEFGRGPMPTEDLLRAAIAVRDEPRAGPDDAPTLRVRREVRLLGEAYFDYRIAARRFVLLVRQADQVRETFVAQPANGPAFERVALADFVDALGRIDQDEERLVAAWAAYQTQRLALLRDLGTLPADDWPGFLGPLTARSVEPGTR